MTSTHVAPDTAVFRPLARPSPCSVSRRACGCSGHSHSGGVCEECRKKGAALHHSPKGSGDLTPISPNVDGILRPPRQSLEGNTRALLETRFGHDLSAVRVHADAETAHSARAVGADTFPTGARIASGAAQYAQPIQPGARLLLREREAVIAPHAVTLSNVRPHLSGLEPALLARQRDGQDELPRSPLSFELDPQLFLKPMSAAAPKETAKCEEFPGGSTDCEVDATGTPTGKVRRSITETNPCTRPCVEQHEAVHVKQMTTFCPQLRDCYRAVDRGNRSPLECAKMALFGNAQRECEAYKQSVPCVRDRLRTAPACQSKERKEYGTRKLASEECFRDKYCAGAGGK